MTAVSPVDLEREPTVTRRFQLILNSCLHLVGGGSLILGISLFFFIFSSSQSILNKIGAFWKIRKILEKCKEKSLIPTQMGPQP